MKLAVLGASGQTGVHLVRQALAQGNTVVALAVRDRRKLEKQLEGKLSEEEARTLVIVGGSAFSAEDLSKHLVGVDAVLSALGFNPRMERHITGYSEATKAIVEAMRLSPSSKKRLVLMHAWFTRPDSRGNSAPQAREIMERISPVLDDMDRAEEYLTESCKDVEWTAVLPGGLNKLKGTTDKEFKVAPRGRYYFSSDYSYFHEEGENSIRRGDVARFMLKVASEGSFVREAVAIAT